MKAALKPLIFFLMTGIIACGDDDDNGPSYKFKDQNLSGKIDNVVWTYADGFAEIVDNGGDVDDLSIKLTLIQDEVGCAMFPEGDMVFFYVPNEVGLYKLSFDMSGNSDSRIVTLYKDDGVDSINIWASEGAVEIVSISATEVSGKIDARSDSESFVNGNFTISLCPG